MSTEAQKSLEIALEAPRRYHQEELLYDVVLGNALQDTHSIIDIGAGAAGFELSRSARGKEVVCVDPSYGHVSDGMYASANQRRVSALAQQLPFRDEQFDAAVSFYTYQHIPDGDIGQALREAIRVTKMAEDNRDLAKGLILINPIFRPELAVDRLAELPWTAGVVGLLDNHAALERANVAIRRKAKDTLVIHKTAALTPERIDELTAMLEQTRVLRPPVRSLGEITMRGLQKAKKTLNTLSF